MSLVSEVDAMALIAWKVARSPIVSPPAGMPWRLQNNRGNDFYGIDHPKTILKRSFGVDIQ